MNTLLFTIEYPPFKGGVARYYKTTVDFWPKKDEIFVLDNNNEKLISKHFFPRWLPALFHLYKKIKKHKIEHVLVGHVLPLGTATLILSKFMNFEYSVFIHGMDIEFAQKTNKKRKLAKMVLKNAKQIICNSSNTKKITERSLEIKNEKKIKIVNPGISPKFSYNKKTIENLKKKYKTQNKFVLLTVARLVKRKGQDTVIEALKTETSIKDDIIYFVAGTGPDEKYLKEKAKTNTNVHFLGEVDENTKWSLIHLCDVFVMPVRENNGDVEGFGISYLEAGIAKKPVIAGRSGGVADAVIDYETGILCDPNSSEDVFEAINELKKNWPLRHHLGETAMKRTGDLFSSEKQAGKIYSIINSL